MKRGIDTVLDTIATSILTKVDARETVAELMEAIERVALTTATLLLAVWLTMAFMTAYVSCLVNVTILVLVAFTILLICRVLLTKLVEITKADFEIDDVREARVVTIAVIFLRVMFAREAIDADAVDRLFTTDLKGAVVVVAAMLMVRK